MIYEPKYNQDNTELLAVPYNMKGITIKSSCRIISGSADDNYAFINAHDSLETIKFENNPKLEKISNYGFFNCTKLQIVVLTSCTNLISIGDYSFSYCSSLATIEFPESLESLGEYSLTCTGLTSLHIPKNVNSLGFRFSQNNEELKSVTFDPDIILKSIGSHSFVSCISLVDITLPKTFNPVNGFMFENCVSLQNVHIAKGNPIYHSTEGIVFKDSNFLVFVPCARTATYTIPKSIVYIGSGAFLTSAIQTIKFTECTNLKELHSYAFCLSKLSGEVNLQNTKIDKIDNACFSNSIGITRIILPATLKTLGGGVFKGLTHEKIVFKGDSFLIDSQKIITNKAGSTLYQYLGDASELTLSKNVKEIAKYCFKDMPIKTIRIQSDLTIIGEAAFQYCALLESINLPKSLTTIRKYAFEGCVSLKSINFGPNLQELLMLSFKNCSSLETVVFDEGNGQPILEIQPNSFSDCTSLTTLTLSNRIRVIHENAFYKTTSLQSVEFPPKLAEFGLGVFKNSGIKKAIFKDGSQVTSFSGMLFDSCTNLQEIKYPKNLNQICERALANTKLVNIELPSSVTSLGDFCFSDCKELVTFKAKTDSKLQTIGASIFSKCKKFKTIVCDNAHFTVDLGALFNKELTTFYILPPASPTKYFAFPEKVHTVSHGALADCVNVEVIFIPKTMTSIGISAFEGCKSLRYINIPSGVTTIGVNAFKGCGELSCDLPIENKTEPLIEMLKEANLPEKCLLPCVVAITQNECAPNILLRAFTILFMVL